MHKTANKKVLLIEADAFLAGIYGEKFHQQGFTVILAVNGEIALKLVRQHLPDVILLDAVLPKLDGFSVLERLKSDPHLQKIPVIMLTNLGQKEDVEKGLRLGAVDYLVKAHFLPDETVTRVKQALEMVQSKNKQAARSKI